MLNKIILITGASSGIGNACAEMFAEHGANIILCARRLERLKDISNYLQKKYQAKIHYIPLDIANAESVINSINTLPKEWQNIEILINNAGLALGLSKFQEGKINDWQQMIATNLNGLLYMSKAVIEGMLTRKNGHIINIGSIAGHDVYSGGAVYAATKHAVNAITKSLRLDLLGTNIRITSVDPGMVETEFSEVRFSGDKDRAKKVYQGMTPLTAMDIADAVYYCASRPPHVNISELIVFPTDQASVTSINRR